MVLLLVLNVLLVLGKVLSNVQVFHNFTLTFESDTESDAESDAESDEVDCTRGQKLLVYDDVLPGGTQPVCNDITTDQLSTICLQLDKCGGKNKKGVVTNLTEPSPYPLYITSDTFTFYSDSFCSTHIVCYNAATHCFLPPLDNGHYESITNTIFDQDVLESGSRLSIVCDKNFAWHWSDSVTCVEMSDGLSQLSSEPQCAPLSTDNKMTFLVDVDNKAHLSALTKVDEALLDPDNSDSILHHSDKLESYCNDAGLCSIPTRRVDVSTPESKADDEPNQVKLLLGEYIVCFDTCIISLFLMGLQEIANEDVYEGYDVRPVKREIVDNNIEARLDGLDLVYNSVDRTVTSINVTFYLFQYNRVIPPSVVTKIMGNVSRDKYDLVLESYCRLKYCENATYQECGDIPTMTFNSFPKPSSPCTFQGKDLSYATPIPMICEPNQYNNESDITLCLYGTQYSPPTLPTCAKCGGVVFADKFHGPSRANGLNARGGNCAWEVNRSHNNTGQFYQTSKGDAKTCSDPVDYLTVTEYASNGNVIKEITDICFGVPMKLGSRFTVRLQSNEKSEGDQHFIFEFEPDLPPQPWYKRYMAIIIAAPVIVVFLVALVFIGVWCDHKNKQKEESPVFQMEYADQISNGTWKANNSFNKNVINIEEETISPQPRIHNAVTKPDQQKKRRKKRRTTPNKTDSADQQMTDSLSPPSYDTWVVVSNPSNQATSLDTNGDNSPEVERDAGSQVFQSPARHSRMRSSTTIPSHSDNVRTTSGTEGSSIKPRKKRRRKKRSDSVQRPLPALNANGGQDLEAAESRNHKNLPPISNNLSKEQSNRALPPIIANKNVDGSLSTSYPYVPDDLGID